MLNIFRTAITVLLSWCGKAIDERQAVRRMVLATVLVLLWMTVDRSTMPEVLMGATAAGGVIVTAIIGLLTLPVKWYFEARKRDSSAD
jgi:uncharacterized membrane-anchored protein